MPSDASIPVPHLRVFLHDVNNELFALGGNLQLYEMQRGKPEGEKTYGNMRHASDELQVLLGELSDYASWCGDGVSVSAAPLDLGEAVQAGVARAAQSLRRYRKEAKVAAAAPVRVVGDATHVARAVHALIRVALWRDKAAEPVPVAVAQEGDLGVVTVEDHGPAIASELLEGIFTPDGILEAKKRGTPPGRPTALLFVRVATEAAGGRCWAKADGGAMRFSAGFPIAR